ncbi:hypothetical protein [Phaeobacter sp.]|uniref:hypothetical protein n=1 Tax=Phaeobacter sp. TaxID=1902409 RepID=UPI0025EB17E3|nr:hypothetical protein [Phaeobacter sp.]
MKRSVCYSILAVVIANVAVASDLSSCAVIEEDSERLKCFDNLVADLAQPQPKAPDDDENTVVEEKGSWIFTASTDDFSGKDTSMVSWHSDRSVAQSRDAPSAIIVRCDGRGGTEILVVSNGYIGARRNSIPVRYKFGENEPVKEGWHESTSGTAAFLPNGYKDFRDGLLSGDDLIFEITDFRGSKYSAKFEDAAPLGEKFEFVWDGCQ